MTFKTKHTTIWVAMTQHKLDRHHRETEELCIGYTVGNILSGLIFNGLISHYFKITTIYFMFDTPT